jgi:hypothetical protein
MISYKDYGGIEKAMNQQRFYSKDVFFIPSNKSSPELEYNKHVRLKCIIAHPPKHELLHGFDTNFFHLIQVPRWYNSVIDYTSERVDYVIQAVCIDYDLLDEYQKIEKKIKSETPYYGNYYFNLYVSFILWLNSIRKINISKMFSIDILKGYSNNSIGCVADNRRDYTEFLSVMYFEIPTVIKTYKKEELKY